MGYDEGYNNKRNKGKSKKKENKKHPYKSGGKYRGLDIDYSSKNDSSK